MHVLGIPVSTTELNRDAELFRFLPYLPNVIFMDG